jgi:hypothetical protein
VFGILYQTYLTNYSGIKKEWPLYFNLGSVNWTIRSKHSNPASILVALLLVPSKYHFTEAGNTTAMKEQQIHNREVLRRVFNLIFAPLNVHLNTGKPKHCAAGQMR